MSRIHHDQFFERVGGEDRPPSTDFKLDDLFEKEEGEEDDENYNDEDDGEFGGDSFALNDSILHNLGTIFVSTVNDSNSSTKVASTRSAMDVTETRNNSSRSMKPMKIPKRRSSIDQDSLNDSSNISLLSISEEFNASHLGSNDNDGSISEYNNNRRSKNNNNNILSQLKGSLNKGSSIRAFKKYSFNSKDSLDTSDHTATTINSSVSRNGSVHFKNPLDNPNLRSAMDTKEAESLRSKAPPKKPPKRISKN